MRLRLALRIIQALLGGASAVAMTLSQQDLPSRVFWERNTILFYAALVILAASAVLAPIVEAIMRYLGERGPAVKLAVQELLIADLHDILQHTGLPFDSIGLHAFLVRRPLRHLFRAEQVRVGRVKISPGPPRSGIRWTKDRGLIGRCWAERMDQGADLDVDWGPHLNANREEWEALPEHLRYGLSYEDFRRTKDSYGAIVASPILDSRDKYRGCVAVDGPGPAFNQLWTNRVRGILQASGQAIWRAIRPVSEA